ncbi:nitrogenase iron protein NifH [methanogenic archaeon mixed culture ISO4-G1]|nr:nitrogenase iron protein NifH [methanogenic archaeon mixed culture ISO4-G1]
MFQIALYGKGGIGKSTMSANISVALSYMGDRVMQIGCDPKHDSTRLLLGGVPQRTIMDYVRETQSDQRELDDIVKVGTNGILCAEAGGPKPGIGCAGRGILTALDTLKKLGAKGLDVDVRLYDVLGDVVCGGFAVPLRNENADGVALVTSGEFMSIYAANNIMKGLRNFDTGKPRFIGIIFNSRGGDNERDVVERFAAATGTSIIAEIPRDQLFSEAEGQGHTVRELFPDSEIAHRFDDLALYIKGISKGVNSCVYPHPLDDDQFTDLIAGREIRAAKHVEMADMGHSSCQSCRRTSINDTRVMQSCAACGAVNAICRINDVGILLHGPESCLYFMNAPVYSRISDLYGKKAVRGILTNRVRCTMMDDAVSVFGGVEYLEWGLKSMLDEGFRKVVVVTTCMPGIIGDDCERVVENVKKLYDGAEILLIPTDGDIAGEYNDGYIAAATCLANLMDVSIKPEKGYVNLIDTTFFDVHTERNMSELNRLLSSFDLKVNCRFLDATTLDSVKGFCRASVDIMLNNTANNRDIYEPIRKRTGREPMSIPLPTGLYECREWMTVIGDMMGKDPSRQIREMERTYSDFIAEHSKQISGKRIIIVNKLNYDIDWLIDILMDLGAELVRIGAEFSARKERAEVASRHLEMITQDYDSEQLRRDLAELGPDLIIANVNSPHGDLPFARLGRIGVGLQPSLDYVEYVENILRLPNDEGWKKGSLK